MKTRLTFATLGLLDIGIWRTILPGLWIELWYCNFDSNSFRILFRS